MEILEKAILRAARGEFPAGTEVTYGSQNIRSDGWRLVHQSECMMFHVRPDGLLPLTDLFKRQPKDRFWALGRMDFSEHMLWLEDAENLTFGYRPFRFESEGELRCLLVKLPKQTGRIWIGQLTEQKL